MLLCRLDFLLRMTLSLSPSSPPSCSLTSSAKRRHRTRRTAVLASLYATASLKNFLPERFFARPIHLDFVIPHELMVDDCTLLHYAERSAIEAAWCEPPTCSDNNAFLYDTSEDTLNPYAAIFAPDTMGPVPRVADELVVDAGTVSSCVCADGRAGLDVGLGPYPVVSSLDDSAIPKALPLSCLQLEGPGAHNLHVQGDFDEDPRLNALLERIADKAGDGTATVGVGRALDRVERKLVGVVEERTAAAEARLEAKFKSMIEEFNGRVSALASVCSAASPVLSRVAPPDHDFEGRAICRSDDVGRLLHMKGFGTSGDGDLELACEVWGACC